MMLAKTINQLSIDALYHQYTDRQTKDAELLRKEEAVSIPADFDYDLSGSSNELKFKLNGGHSAYCSCPPERRG